MIARRFTLALLLAAPAVAHARPDACGETPYQCALAHVARGEFAAAIQKLEPQLHATPRDLKLLNLLGVALTGAGRKREANQRFREALARDPRFYPALKNLAINQYDAGESELARRGFEGVLKLAPDDEVAHLYLAELDHAAGRCRDAIAHYAKGGERWAQDSRSTLHYGRCLLDAGRAQDALTVLERVPAGAGASLFEAGVALGQTGAHAEAARFFGRARGSYHDPYAAGYNQLLMLVEAGDGEAAVAVTRELIAAGNATAELYNLASRAHLQAGQVVEAYDALRQATRLAPGAVENYIDLASICLEHDNFDLGLEIAEIGLERRPESWMLHVLRGVLLAMKARLAEAEAAFEEARRLAPREPVPYAALGMAWMQSGQTDKAVEVLRAEQARASDHVVPYIYAVALLRSGAAPASPEALEAVRALRASIRAQPDFAPAHVELGRLLFKRDELDPAIAELERAAALDPGSAAALYTLSQAYRRKGEREKAQRLLERVSRLNASERGDDDDAELRRAVVRIVREGNAPARPAGQQ